MAMNNVWGRGGLFEQALASKLGNQDAETALKSSQVGVDAMNANTKLAEVGNNYDLGLRNDAVNRGQLDVNRGQLGVNQMNSMSKRMDSETSRVANAPASLISSPVANNLGLRTYNAVSPEAAAEFGKSYGGVGTDLFKPFGMKNGGLVMKPKMVQPGYMHGGKITPPKGYENGGMVGSQVPEWVAKSRAETRATPEFKQAIGELTKKGWKPNPKDPESDIDAVDKYLFATKTLPETKAERGYKKGGMIGCAKGGKIGDVKKDTGKDTINAKVRPGEYMLNPETVAHIGGGNYEAGVRNLNQIVREATGKEPGPVPVGKSGKAGFEDSGVVPPNRALVPVYDPNRGPGPNGFGPVDEAAVRAERMRYPIPVYDRRYGPGPNGFGPASQYTYNSAMGPNDGPSVRERFTRFNNPDVGASIRAGAQRAATAVRGAVPQAVQGADKGLRVAGKVFTPLAVAADTADVVDVATDPNMAGRDVAGEVAGKAAKWAGATAGAIQGGSTGAAIGTAILPGPGTALGGTIGALGGGVLGYFGVDKLIEGGRALRGVDTRDPSEYSQGVVSDLLGQQNQPTAAAAAPAKEEAKAKPEAAPRDYDKEVADKLAESKVAAEAAKPSLRDMMLTRLRNIDRIAATNGGLGSQYWNNARNEAVNSLTELDKANTAAATSLANARATAGTKLREDADKRIGERFQIPIYDKEGNIKGYEKDPNAANALRDFAAQTYVDESGAPMDFYRLTPQQQDIVMQEYDVNSRGTRRLNERLASEGGYKARLSNLPRIGANSLRSDGEITLHDIFDPNISFDDVLTSFGSNQMEKKVMRDPVTGQRVAARHVLMNENGTIDDDLIAQINRAAAARAEAEAAAKAKKK